MLIQENEANISESFHIQKKDVKTFSMVIEDLRVDCISSKVKIYVQNELKSIK